MKKLSLVISLVLVSVIIIAPAFADPAASTGNAALNATPSSGAAKPPAQASPANPALSATPSSGTPAANAQGTTGNPALSATPSTGANPVHPGPVPSGVATGTNAAGSSSPTPVPGRY